MGSFALITVNLSTRSALVAAGAPSSHGQHNLEQVLAHFVKYITVHRLSMNDQRPLKFTHKFSKNVLLARAFSLGQSGGLSADRCFDTPRQACKWRAAHLRFTCRCWKWAKTTLLQ
jgi:hypothetical protein